MTTLLLGGIKAKTSSRLAALLAQSNTPFLLASRSASSPESSPSPYPQAKFDWLDESTYVTPFDESVQKTGHEVSAVYLVAPPVTDMLPPMKAFIDLAVRDKKVQRVVLLSASSLEKGGVAMGKVHEYVEKLAGEVGFEYAVLRPTWFMENFSQGTHQETIKNDGKIYSATQEGMIPFISADDIAAVAYHALTDKEPLNTDPVILGPELLSYDDVAKTLSDTLGRTITHVKLEPEQLAAGMVAHGLPKEYANMLATMDQMIAAGAEDRLNDTVLKMVGKAPRKFSDFAAENRAVWN